MDSNNWLPFQADPPPMEANGANWRTTLQAASRSRNVTKIMDTLKRNFPSSGQEGVQELKKFAMIIEEKSYHAATSQSDYLRRISLNLLTMESKSSGSGPIPNAMPSNSAGMSRNPQDPGSQTMQPQGQNQGQSLPIPMASNPPTVQGRPQLLAQNIRSNISTGGVQSSASLPSALPSVNSLAKNNMPNVMQKSNIQNMPGVSQNSMGNSMVQQGVASNIYTNSQKQQMVQGRKNMLQRGSHQQIQQSQNQQQYMYQQQQLQQQQQVLKQKLQQASLDSMAQTGSTEAQEEVYQKLKAMKDMYLTTVKDAYKTICLKLQKNDSLPQQPKSEGVEKRKDLKQMLERVLSYLQLSKINALKITKERVAQLEKQIISVVSWHRLNKPGPPLQQGLIPPSHLQSLQQNQQSHSQIPQTQSHESGGQLQNVQGSTVPSMQHGDMNGLHGPVSSLSGITTSQQNMMNSLQPGSNLDSGQGNAPNSIQQVAVGSIQQNPVSAPQPASVQTGVNMLQSTMKSLQPNSNMLQRQHIKQEQQLKQQFQQRQHTQQQMLHKQQLHLHQLKQQPGKMQGHQMPRIHQMNDVNDIKLRQIMGLKPGLLPQNLSQGQRYSHQELKPGVSFPNSSPQMLQAGSPQINQHSSPQIEQPNILPPLNKAGTPLQSANSPFLPTMSPLAPSPMPGDPEKPNSATSNAANIIQQQTTVTPASTSLAIGTPGISASPLLADSSPPDGHGTTTLTTLPGKAGVTDQPFERLLEVVKSMSSKALNASVGDIVSVVSMIDRIAGSAPGNGSRSVVGEDLVAMTECRLQARNFITQDGSSGMKRMRRYTSAMPLNVASSVGSPNNSFKQLTGPETSEVESAATSSAKRPRIEVNPTLTEELKEINEHLIDTVVAFSDEDVDPTLSAVAAEGGEGTIVKCTYSAVSLSPNLKSQYCSAQMSQIQPLRLLVPTNYPNCSPILLDKLPEEVSKEYDDLSVKVKSRFSISLRALSEPISIREIARTWDDCARAVVIEYAHQSGGGTFSSKYGTWENCLTAT